MTSILIKNLKTYYNTAGGPARAVDDVSFSLECGESIGIAGESGCGKSTLGLSIVRATPEHSTTTGEVILGEKSIFNLSKLEFTKNIRWKEISMVFQGAMNSLDPVFTIEEQFVEVLKQHHFDGKYNEKISEMVESVGLNQDVLKKYPHELSGGMKQRIVIAMALVLKPKFIIADEPTTALDVLVQAQVINLLKKLKKDGLSIMLITHDLGIISEIAEKIGIMYAGQIVEFGTASEVFKNSKHPYTQCLLKSIPRLKGDKITNFIKGTPPSLINPPKGCRFRERCPQAMEKCKQDPINIKTDSGYVACWLYE